MTYVLIAAFLLFLTDNRRIKRVLLCFLPVFLVMPAFFRMKSLGGWAFYTGLILIGLSPVLEKLFGGITLKLPVSSKRGNIDISSAEEEDILDNKKKWRLIVSGYVIFVIFVLLSVAAFFTLNTKINNIYEFSNSQQEEIELQQKTIESQQEELEKLKLKIDKNSNKAEDK